MNVVITSVSKTSSQAMFFTKSVIEVDSVKSSLEIDSINFVVLDLDS